MRTILSFIAPLFVFCAVWLAAGIAWASGDSDSNAATQLAQMAIELLTPILAIIGAWIAHKAVKAFEAKTGVDVPDKIEAKIDAWIEQGIHIAAERSYRKVKEGTEKLTGPEKAEEAADFVLAMVKARGWDTWTKDKIFKKLDAAIGVHRANGGVPQ